MVRRKLSPGEIVERLRAVEALVAGGQPIGEALWLAGVPSEYEQWRSEFAGLLRTLGPLTTAPPNATTKSRRGKLA